EQANKRGTQPSPDPPPHSTLPCSHSLSHSLSHSHPHSHPDTDSDSGTSARISVIMQSPVTGQPIVSQPSHQLPMLRDVMRWGGAAGGLGELCTVKPLTSCHAYPQLWSSNGPNQYLLP